MPIALLLLLLSLLSPPLPLEAVATPGEVTAGGVLTIDAYLFNDGSSTVPGTITIEGPAGFLPLSTQVITGDIAPGQALHATLRFQVGGPPGVARFIVRSNRGGPVVVAVRVCCAEAPPARFHVDIPMVRR